MRKIWLYGIGAALLSSASVFATTVPASAGVGVSIGIGVPGPVYGPAYYGGGRWRCRDWWFRDHHPYFCSGWAGPGYAPFYVDYAPWYAGSYFYGPVYFGGFWYHGPYQWRWDHGERAFWVNGGWHRNEWHGAVPEHVAFRNGGSFERGRFGGFADAERFNGRMRMDNHAIGQDRRDLAHDRQDMRGDRTQLHRDQAQRWQDRRD